MSLLDARSDADKAEATMFRARGAFAEAQDRLNDARRDVERRRVRLVEAAKAMRDAREAVLVAWAVRNAAEAKTLATIEAEDEPLIAAALQEENPHEHA